MGEYESEPHEKIMISSYLLLAYWLKGDSEGAFVERNRLVGRLKQYTDGLSEKDRAALDVPFARYLAAVMYEIEGRADDARIEYDAIAKVMPDAVPEVLDPNLERARRLRRGRPGAGRRVSTEIRGYLQKDGGNLVGFFNLPGGSAPQMFFLPGFGDLSLDKPGVLFTFAFPRCMKQPRTVAALQARDRRRRGGRDEAARQSREYGVHRLREGPRRDAPQGGLQDVSQDGGPDEAREGGRREGRRDQRSRQGARRRRSRRHALVADASRRNRVLQNGMPARRAYDPDQIFRGASELVGASKTIELSTRADSKSIIFTPGFEPLSPARPYRGGFPRSAAAFGASVSFNLTILSSVSRVRTVSPCVE